MNPEQAAQATAAAISSIGSKFMLDGMTYAKGAALGFNGIDFYAAGRGGVLGDVDADVVAAGFVFFNPVTVRAAWDGSRPVLPRDKSAQAWAECGHAWGEANLPDDLDAIRLAELAGRVVSAASPSGAPVFAGWRALAVPSSPKAAALHQANGLRELRMARHGCAVIAHGIDPADAVRHKSPQLTALFGWDGEIADPEAVKARWDAAEEATNHSMALVLRVLDDRERAELTDLLNTANSTQ